METHVFEVMDGDAERYAQLAERRRMEAFRAIVEKQLDEATLASIECADLPASFVYDGQVSLLAVAIQMAADNGADPTDLRGTQAEAAAVVAMTYGRGAKGSIEQQTGAAHHDGDMQHAQLLFEARQLSLSRDPQDQQRFRGFQAVVDIATAGQVHVEPLARRNDRNEKATSAVPSIVRKFAAAAGIAGALTAAQGMFGMSVAQAATNEGDKATPDNKTIVVTNTPDKSGIDLKSMTATVAPQSEATPVPSTATIPPQPVAETVPSVPTTSPSTPAQAPEAAAASAQPTPTAAPNQPDAAPTVPAVVHAQESASPSTIPDQPQHPPTIHETTPAPALPLLAVDQQPDLSHLDPALPVGGHAAANIADVTTTAPAAIVGVTPDLSTLPAGQQAADQAPPAPAPDLSQIKNGTETAVPYTPAPVTEQAPVAPSQPAAPQVPAAPAPAPAETAPTNAQQDYLNAAQQLINQGGEWANRGEAMKFFMEDPDLHMTPSEAAGFVGNLLGENSAMDPGKHQNGGPAFGIAQWEAGRLQALKDFGGDKYDQLDVQLQFIKHELLTSEHASLDQLRQAPNDRRAAAAIVATYYERPSVPRIAERQAYADEVGNAFNTEYQKIIGNRTVITAARMVIGTDVKTLFNQCDAAWGNIDVNGFRTCDMGCGPTDVAMVVDALTGQTITPRDVYDYITQAGLWLPNGQGTSFDAIIAAAKHWGVNGYQLDADKLKKSDVYRSILSNGGLVVTAGNGPAQNKAASLPFVPSDEGAHYVVVHGMDQSGNLLVADSYPKTSDTNSKAWATGDLLSKVFGAVVFTKG